MPGSYSMSGEMSGSSLGGRRDGAAGLPCQRPQRPATAAASDRSGQRVRWGWGVGAVDDGGLSGLVLCERSKIRSFDACRGSLVWLVEEWVLCQPGTSGLVAHPLAAPVRAPVA